MASLTIGLRSFTGIRTSWRAWVYVLMALIFGPTASFAARDYYESITQPVIQHILGLNMITAPNGTRQLVVEYDSPPSPNCVRERQQLVKRLRDDGKWDFYPIASARNGMGMGHPGHFFVHYDLPSWVPLDGIFEDRSTYTCPIFPLGVAIRQVVGPTFHLPPISR